MKSILLLAIAATTLFYSGCRTVAVIDAPRPVYGYTSVSYSHGRPYYYRNRVHYWGYPPGYHGTRVYAGPRYYGPRVYRY